MSDHHLRACVRLVGREDVVLSAVSEAIEQQIDAQQEQAPRVVALRVRKLGRVFLAGFRRGGVVEGEDRDPSGDERDDNVFVQRVRFPEQRDVEEHHRQKLARLGEDESDIVDVRQRGVAERGRQGRCDSDEEERS